MRRPEPFALPFAALGTVTSLFVFDLEDSLTYIANVLCIPGADILRRRDQFDWDERTIVAIVGFLSFALAGKLVSHRIRIGGTAISAALTASFAATQGPAALVGLLSMGVLWGRLMFAGVLVSLVAAPCAMVMARNLERAQQARPGSILARVHRRAIWLNASIFSVGLAALYSNPMFDPRWSADDTTSQVARAVVAIATLTGFVAGTLVLSSLAKLRRLHGRCDRSDALVVDDSNASDILDIGMGEHIQRDVKGGAGAYRSRAETRAMLIGDAARGFRTLRWALALAALVVLLGELVLFFEPGPFDVDLDVRSPLCEPPLEHLTWHDSEPTFP